MYYDPIISGKRMQQLRKGKNLGTQHDVDCALGIGDGTYGNIERGQAVSIDMAVCIAQYFGVTLDYLVLGVTPNSNSNDGNNALLDAIFHLCLEINSKLDNSTP